ncbi:MAG: hypothetical protein CL873_02380 [Dehalococcoidales bacterium]|nr:hypothetical protein [Dehalococcoidales bacterium]
MKQLRELFSLRNQPRFWSLYVVVPMLVVAVAGGVNCSNDVSPQIAEEIAQDEETTQVEETTISNSADPVIPVLPVLQSDLEITRLELGGYGSKLSRGSTFSILVQVTNHGQVASGEYTVEIYEKIDFDTLWGLIGGCGCGAPDDLLYLEERVMMDSYPMDSLAPGETHIIEKEDALLEFVSLYTISAEITPIGWQEDNNSNNIESLDIEVW